MSDTCDNDADLKQLFLSSCPLLDVRAPIEFNRGSFPTASNIPILDDQQRQMVGTEYKKRGRERAIELGTRLLDGPAREHRLQAWTHFVQENPEGQMFCYRGGLRSRYCQDWLADAGVSYPVVSGGYKRMRRFLLQTLERCSVELPFVILGGRTGSGKTRLLTRLPRYIDLEALASHRGSSFGKLLQPQPSNAGFENSLAIQLLRQEQEQQARQADQSFGSGSIFLEDEGKLIGRVSLPQELRERMLQLPVVLLEEPVATRVAVSKKDYITDLLSMYQNEHGLDTGFDLFAEHHLQALKGIRKRFGGQRASECVELFQSAVVQHRETGDTELYDRYIALLLTEYYDPMYDYQFASKQRRVLFKGNAEAVMQWVGAANSPTGSSASAAVAIDSLAD